MKYVMALVQRMKELGDSDGAAPRADLQPLPPVTRADDGYHFPAYQGESDEWYLEWWYFNFQDPKSGWAGIVLYQIFNPRNRAGLGRSGLSLLLFPPGGQALVEQDTLGVDDFQAAPDRADVRVGAQNRVEHPDDDTHRIRAVTANRRVALDLTFTRTDGGVFLSRDMQGPYRWETASWMAYSPEALVQGTLEVDGQRISLAGAPGYHDHNWGAWLLPARTFVWAAFADPGRRMHFDYGLSRGFSPGNRAVLRVGDLRLQFPPERIEDPRPSDFRPFADLFGIWRYPARVDVTMVDSTGEYRLDIGWDVLATGHLPEAPVVIFEHRARIEGTLRRRQDGGWQAFQQVGGEGFAEWTDTWIPGL